MSQQFSGRRRRRGGAFSPGELFANGEQGAWYDPSDFATLYQDSAGTTPVTALGQPVGLMLDKSGNGHHASQSIITARPTVQARVNLATPSNASGYVDGSIFGVVNYPSLTSGVADPFGGTDAYEAVSISSERLGTQTSSAETIPVTGDITVSMWVRLTSGSAADVELNLRSETVSDTDTVTLDSFGVDSTWQRISFTSNRDAANGDTGWYFQFLNNTTLEIYGIQFELGSTATTYQRVTTATDYADIGLPRYLEFDGADDYMETGQVDPGAVDDWSTFLGVKHRVFVATRPTPFSFGGYVADGYVIQPNDVSTEFRLARNGDNFFDVTVASNIVPSVLSAINSSSGADLRANGTTASSNQVRNIGSNAITLGRRADNSSQYFDGKLFQVIARIATTSGALLDQTERFVARKTGVTL